MEKYRTNDSPVMNVRVLVKNRNFLTAKAAVNFPRNTLFDEGSNSATTCMTIRLFESVSDFSFDSSSAYLKPCLSVTGHKFYQLSYSVGYFSIKC
jgi:hypothetical protein